jgi:lysophospholipase L1-like esterase
VFLALCASGAAGRVRAQERQDKPVANAAQKVQSVTPLRILALGDSYTIGEGVDAKERWPEQLALALEQRGLSVAVPEIVARTGWTSADLGRAIERSALKPPYDLVTLLIGVNDQFQGYQESDYRRRFVGLLQRAVALAGGDPKRVLVISIPDYSVTPFAQRFEPLAIRAALVRYNETNRAVAAELGVAHVDITPISRGAEQDRSLLAPDQLHPSGKMYREWVNRVLPLAEAALKRDAR